MPNTTRPRACACRVERGRGWISRNRRRHVGRHGVWARSHWNGHPDRAKLLHSGSRKGSSVRALRKDALPRGFGSSIALPLNDEHANTFGSLTIHSAQPNAFTSEEIRLLEELAGDLAFGIVALRSRAAPTGRAGSRPPQFCFGQSARSCSSARRRGAFSLRQRGGLPRSGLYTHGTARPGRIGC